MVYAFSLVILGFLDLEDIVWVKFSRQASFNSRNLTCSVVHTTQIMQKHMSIEPVSAFL